MIQPAGRLDGISEYYFAGKLREIAQMQRDGKPVLNLGIGSPDQPPAAEVQAALEAAQKAPQAHGYQSYTGIPALREAWAKWYAQHYGVKLDPTQEILPLIGSKEGIVHIAMTFLEAGDQALVPNPGYPTYKAATLLAGAEPVFYNLAQENGWLPDLEALAQTDLSRVKIMWVNYPHMPTGAVSSPELFQKLVDFGRKHRILIVNDNPYSFILNNHPLSILAAEGASEAAIELNSLSKSHNMAGWRIGMVAGRSTYLQAILRFKSNMDSGQFLPMQHAAIQALQLPDDWYTQLNDRYRARQRVAFQILNLIDCQYNPAQQGMFVWARIPARYADGYALSDRMLHEAHVFLTPGGIFGTAGEQYIRISLCSDEAVLQEGWRRIGEIG
jgi:LL-diaminopimelate aminotransferase